MFRRKSDTFLLYVAANVLILIALLVHAFFEQRLAVPRLSNLVKMVREYELTDLVLFTDARYARHPAMADLNTAFQDHPLSLEHFPSGSFIIPPPHLRSYGLD